MSDYISRQIIAEHIDMYAKLLTMGDYRLGMMKAKEILLNQESADMVPEIIKATDLVPVVRCKDCKYRGSRRWCELHSTTFDDNAFCSYGERMK